MKLLLLLLHVKGLLVSQLLLLLLLLLVHVLHPLHVHLLVHVYLMRVLLLLLLLLVLLLSLHCHVMLLLHRRMKGLTDGRLLCLMLLVQKRGHGNRDLGSDKGRSTDRRTVR